MNKKHFKLLDLLTIILILISLPLTALGLWFTNNTLTLPGNTDRADAILEVEGATKTNGSFSTIYVISMDHSTKLQNLISDVFNYGEREKMPTHYLHFSSNELRLMGKIQFESAINLSIINAYSLASKNDLNINLDYHLRSLTISFYYPNSPFKIGDEIIGINDIKVEDANFIEAINKRKPNDILKLKRANKLIEIKLDEINFNKFYFEEMYEIDFNSLKPKIKINSSNNGGPSGGFIRSLSLYNSLTSFDYSRGLKIAGTGAIDINGKVLEIGGIKEKVISAFNDQMDIFLCPVENYEEAMLSYNRLKDKERMKIYPIESLEKALEVLANV